MRRSAQVLLLLALAASRAAAGEAIAHAPEDPPRWRGRLALTQAVGGGADAGSIVTMFPTTLELTFRIWKPLSLTAAFTGVLAGVEYDACGRVRRPSAALGTAGVRVDFANGRSASWVAPFLEVHGGVGKQGAPREQLGLCEAAPVFGTGGARLGLDVWLGRVAVTVAATYDWLPTAGPISFALGAAIVLF